MLCCDKEKFKHDCIMEMTAKKCGMFCEYRLLGNLLFLSAFVCFLFVFLSGLLVCLLVSVYFCFCCALLSGLPSSVYTYKVMQ